MLVETKKGMFQKDLESLDPEGKWRLGKIRWWYKKRWSMKDYFIFKYLIKSVKQLSNSEYNFSWKNDKIKFNNLQIWANDKYDEGYIYWWYCFNGMRIPNEYGINEHEVSLKLDRICEILKKKIDDRLIFLKNYYKKSMENFGWEIIKF